MNKTTMALAAVLALGVGFASQANAGNCAETVHAICDWAFPGDTTVETEQNYGACMIAGNTLCNANREDQVSANNLKRIVKQSPKPSPMVLKQYERNGWQNATKN